MACPKLDDVDLHIDKLADILIHNPEITTLLVPIMGVPCCRGLIYACVKAIERANRNVTPRLYIIGDDGEIEEELPQSAQSL
jgi:hypothetical protein